MIARINRRSFLASLPRQRDPPDEVDQQVASMLFAGLSAVSAGPAILSTDA